MRGFRAVYIRLLYIHGRALVKVLQDVPRPYLLPIVHAAEFVLELLALFGEFPLTLLRIKRGALQT